MKISKKALIMLLLGGVSVLSLSCTAKSDAAVSANQIITVPRANLTVDITAVGNLALSRTEDLAFDIFYAKAAAKATVGEVLVAEGNAVKEGQVLATLDTSEWAEQLKALEDKVEAADRQVTVKKRALLQTEINLTDAKTALQDAEAADVWPAEIYTARAAVWDAESQVEEAQAVLRGDQLVLVYNRALGMYQPHEIETAWDKKVWNDKLTAAEATLIATRVKLDKLLAESTDSVKVKNAEERLSTAQAKLASLLAQSTSNALAQSTTEAQKIELQKKIEIQKTEVELAKEQLKNAQNALTGVAKKRLQLEQAKGNVEDAQQAIEDAKKALADAQKALDDAKVKSPLITAPFAGFITLVNVKGGDEVLNGAVAVQIADPNKFEADIMVSEANIQKVKVGGTASVQVEAIPGLSLSANVTHIAPTATVQSGVVNYKVKVEIQPLQSVTPGQPPATNNLSSGNVTSGVPSGSFRPPFGSGNMTQEQIDQMSQQRQQTSNNLSSANITSPRQPTGGNSSGTISPRQGGTRASQGQMPTMLPSDFQLKQGLTVTVSIMIQERNDVLLVPNGAITRRGSESMVKVSKGGVIEERAITTGINNWQYTEVINGLSEGEQVVVPKSTTTTPTTQQQGGMRIPGMGGFGR